MTPTLIDLTGKRFHRLTVKSLHPEKLYGRTAWLCLCDCGKVLTVTGNSLQKENTKSCGCLNLELIGARRRTHGKSKTPEYVSWCAMKHRCCNPKGSDYQAYGGRGIKVCKRWLHSFENFLADMGPKPTPAHELDRINNDRGYSPSNCRWVTRKKQCQNQRRWMRIKVGKLSLTPSGWAELTGLRATTIISRLSRGWPARAAVMTPKLTTWNKNRKDNYRP